MATSQKDKILKHLEKVGHVTRYQAKILKVGNLRARVCELRADGWKIETETVERLRWVNSKGQRHLQAYTVAKYVLKSA